MKKFSFQKNTIIMFLAVSTFYLGCGSSARDFYESLSWWDCSENIRLLTKAIKSDDAYDFRFLPDCYYKRAECYYELSFYDLALKDLDKCLSIVEKYPTRDVCYFLKAKCYFKLNRFDESMEEIEKAKNITPKPTYYIFRGEINLEKGEYKVAKLDFSAAILSATREMSKYDWDNDNTAQQEKAHSYLLRGKANLGLFNKDDACEDFRKALQLGDTLAFDYVKECLK